MAQGLPQGLPQNPCLHILRIDISDPRSYMNTAKLVDEISPGNNSGPYEI